MLVRKRVVRGEHHRGADEHRARERGLDRDLTLAALADITGGRAGIGTDARDMREALDTGAGSLCGDAAGGLDMHGVEGLAPVLNIKADRVHRPVGAGERIGDRALVVNVDRDRPQVRIIERKELAASIGMPRRDPH
jgi:hypothetical protein